MMRRLKIAVSALSLCISASLTMFWIRSYRTLDVVAASTPFPSWVLMVESIDGKISVTASNYPTTYNQFSHRPTWESWPGFEPVNSGETFGLWRRTEFMGCTLLYWLPVLITGVAAVAPWILTRFNLKTMLLVMTFLAVVMGAIAYQAR
jgi:hypothetical protein